MSNDNGVADGDIEIKEIPGGRVVKPIGSIFTLASKVVSKMTDIELKAHITETKSKLQSKKMEVTSLEVMLSQGTHEQSLRAEKERIRLRNTKIPVRQQAKVSPTTQAEAFKAVAEHLKKMYPDMTPEQIAAAILKFAGDKL